MSFCPKYARVGCRGFCCGQEGLLWGGIVRQKKRETHLNDVEELGDDGRDSAEEARPAASLHAVLESLDLDKGASLFRDFGRDATLVDLLYWGQEDGRDAGCRERVEEVEVACEWPWVGGQVLVRSELRRVHEDGEDRSGVLSE